MGKNSFDYGYSLSKDHDLHHNASVCYWNTPYTSSATGEEFYCKEVALSNDMEGVILTCKEAFFLLQWLKQEEAELKRVVKEVGGIDL